MRATRTRVARIAFGRRAVATTPRRDARTSDNRADSQH
jgi:hypothetical protein